MSERDSGRIVLGALLLLSLCVFLIGIGWGLPSRRIDPYLFGGRQPWTGEQIAQLAGERSADAPRGADVDANPVQRGTDPVFLNETDEKRAEILRRYRLFTYQPDEMITMMSLASMKPGEGDFDPRLYQYGGLWVYPIGAMLKIASLANLITLAPSQEYYLDHPEQFARFYIVARLYVVMWAMLGAWAVFRIAYNARAGLFASAAAVLLYTFLPVVVNMSHEAKPHLPGAVLILLSALAAGKFIDTRLRRWWVMTGILCGAAAGMILSGALAFAVLPAMALTAPMPWPRRIGTLIAAAAIGAGVYFITNPYVLIHLFHDRAMLISNLGNSTAMYEAGRLWEGLFTAGRLVAEGATPLVAVTGILGSFLLFRRAAAPQASALRALILVAAIVIVQFISLAAGKPGEYGRFAILPDIALALSAAVMVGRARIRAFEKAEVLALLIGLAVLPSLIYLRGFIRDSGGYPRRIEYARMLAVLHRMGARTIGVPDEPAPYLLPPVSLFDWDIYLLPRGFEIDSSEASVDVIVRPADRLEPGLPALGAYQRISERTFDDLFPSQISWANKAMEIWVRADLRERE